ncbi:MAG: glycosyltransferase family 2 protein, partial [Clostridia bacterium]|nr:glycosyltransferase family 2 protein [Clostridia bacterium]
LKQLIEGLDRQTVPVHKIILINTDEQTFMKATASFGSDFFTKRAYIVIKHISTAEFDHGKTRNEARTFCDADTDVYIYMTQDAVPADTRLIEKLIEPFEEEEVLITYARQMASEQAGLIEQFTREYNYPDKSVVRSLANVPTEGIKAYFCSNVCAAYRSTVFEMFGSFVDRTIFNEDMIFAANVLKGGGKIAYAADAKVIHSHNYTNMKQLRRNFDLAVSQADHPEVFLDISSEAEGMRYLKQAVGYFSKHKKNYLIVPFIITCVFKYAGYWLGYRYRKLSPALIRKITMNYNYWDYKL